MYDSVVIRQIVGSIDIGLKHSWFVKTNKNGLEFFDPITA